MQLNLTPVNGGGGPPELSPLQRLGAAVIVPLLVLILAVGQSVYYTVEPEEVGVVLTFGAFTKTTNPGLHFKWPFPIQTVEKVPVQRQLKQEFGFRTVSAGVRSQFESVGAESLMLTGDLNVADVEWTTQFRVVDPERFLFRVRNLVDTFRDMNEAVMRTIVGDRSVSEVLTVGRQEIATEVETRLQELCDQYEMGIRIEQIVLQDVTPPDPVKPSFNEVNQAQQERERMINEARSEFNSVIPRARGEALQTIQRAEGYATDRVNRAEGDAARFVSVYEAYSRAPEVTRRRLYLETMLELLPQVRQTFVFDEDLEGLTPMLSFEDSELRAAAAASQGGQQ